MSVIKNAVGSIVNAVSTVATSATTIAKDVGSLFSIPGDIKQRYMPFVLNPQQTDSPQYFTFKNVQDSTAGNAQLNICPTTVKKHLKSDISNQLIYNQNARSITADDIFNNIPSIQIREFLPDARLDQCLNLFSTLIKDVYNLFTKDRGSNGGNASDFFSHDPTLGTGFWSNLGENLANTSSNIMATLWHAWSYIVGQTQPRNLFTNLLGGNDMKGNTIFKYGQTDKLVLNFPYTLYYRLQSCQTTNIYEIPFSTKSMYSSDGSKGWGGANELAINSAVEKIPLIGGMLNKLFNSGPFGAMFQNLRINYMPWWQSKEGSGTPDAAIEVKFDLFNDTAEAAKYNFIFVNSLVANNRWIQYGMFQHSPCLYDIKIEGINRLFACNATVKVDYQGILRNPPQSWLEDLVNKHSNSNALISPQQLKENHQIKIPDVYSVTMTFNSILPSNFNTFIYNYTQNNDIYKEYKYTTRQDSQLNNIIKACTTDLLDEVTEYVNQGGFKNPTSTKSYSKQ